MFLGLTGLQSSQYKYEGFDVADVSRLPWPVLYTYSKPWRSAIPRMRSPSRELAISRVMSYSFNAASLQMNGETLKEQDRLYANRKLRRRAIHQAIWVANVYC